MSDILEEIKAKQDYIQLLRINHRTFSDAIYNEWKAKGDALSKKLKEGVDAVQKDIDYLKQEYAKQPSLYPDLDAVIDRIIEGFPLYRGRQPGYGRITILFGSTNEIKHHLQSKYYHITHGVELIVFIGDVGCSKEDRLVLQKYGIDSRTESGWSGLN